MSLSVFLVQFVYLLPTTVSSILSVCDMPLSVSNMPLSVSFCSSTCCACCLIISVLCVTACLLFCLSVACRCFSHSVCRRVVVSPQRLDSITATRYFGYAKNTDSVPQNFADGSQPKFKYSIKYLVIVVVRAIQVTKIT